MPFININNINIFYKQQGQGEDLILIGGLTANHTVWEEMLPLLVAKYRVLWFDNRGAGQSDVPAIDHTVREMAQDVIGLMDHLGINQANILGHSMGGIILQQLLLDHAERIKKAIICSSEATIPAATLWHIKTAGKLAALNLDPNLLLENEFAWLFGGEFLNDEKRVRATVQRINNDPYAQTPAGYERQINAIINFDSSNKLKNINVETLIIVGKEDIITPIYCSEFLHKQIKNSKLIVMEKGGHMLQWEYPQELAEIIKDFI